MGELFRWLLEICGIKTVRLPREATKPWLIDRDGRVYKPEKRVVLKATTSGEPTAAQLARMHPEVLDAHAQFGGDLQDMLRRYHQHEDRT